MPTATDAELELLLAEGDLTVVGAIKGSSNHALLVEVGTTGLRAIYKPLRGERPLWDYPDGTLIGRERAAYLVSHLGGFGVVPPTILRDGPYGPGSVQAWIGGLDGESADVVRVCPPVEVPPGWPVVLEARTPEGAPIVLAHSADEHVRRLALFDAVINNSDRKGGHILDDDGRLRGIDHGVSLSAEPKLRTVLWGFAGAPLSGVELGHLEDVGRALAEPVDSSTAASELDHLLTATEIQALAHRISELLERGTFPRPSPNWPAIPWPAL